MNFEGNRTTREAIREIPEPLWTDSWHPVSHRVCDIIVNNTVDKLGLQVDKTIYSASKAGENVTGMLIIKNGNTGLNPALFWRNSINKTFAFSLAVGTFTSMCSNGMIYGWENQFKEFRKHTGRLDETELSQVVYKGIDNASKRMYDIKEWHLSMENVILDSTISKSLAYDAIYEGIISKQRVPEFNDLLFGENHEYDCSTLFGFHGACTQLYREMRMGFRFAELNKKLFKFIDDRYRLHLYSSSNLN